MIEKLCRHKNKILTAFLVAVLCVCSFSFDSKAAVVDEYYLDYAEPTCSERQGYFSLALQNKTTDLIDIVTFFWTSYCEDESGGEIASSVSVTLNSDEISFSPYANIANYNNSVTLITRIDASGVYVPYPVMTGASSKVSWAFVYHNYRLVGFKYGGNCYCYNTPSQSYAFALYFAADGAAQQLMYIYGLLQSSNDLSNSQNTKLTNIYNQQVSTNQKLDDVKTYLQSIRGDLSDISTQLDEILGEEKKQTSWLQKIWEALTGSDEQKDKIEEESSKAEQQAGQLEDLNEQNQTEKVDPGQANESVNGAIDQNQIQNYSIVLSVFTNESHISQMLLIVIAIALVGYVFFGKR